MITVIVFFALAFGIAIYLWIEDMGFDFEGFIIAFVLGLGAALIGGIIALCIPTQHETVLVDTRNVVTLQDNSSVSGSFFLGCGSIDGDMKYVYYYEKDGLYRMDQIDYDEAAIKYVDGNPEIERYQDFATDLFWNKFTILALDNKQFIIKVPKGTIKQGFVLDAK